MSAAAKPMVTLYLRMGSPCLIARAAILWPAGTWLRLVSPPLQLRADADLGARDQHIVRVVQPDGLPGRRFVPYFDDAISHSNAPSS